MSRIVSASRRTDLPGFHAHWLARRLAAMRAPPDALFVWTKHPGGLVARGPLRDEIARLPNVVVHLTVTGLGASRYEPSAPPARDALALVPDLVNLLGGDSRRVLWRYDPIVLGASSPDDFRRLADRFAAIGVRRCISSFPSTFSLKGSLLPQYALHGVRTASIAEKIEWAETLLAESSERGIEWGLCCQPKVVARMDGRVRAVSCIDAALATALHPSGVRFPEGRDPSQRKACRCAPSNDIGSYTDHRCRTGCVYCYSKAGGPATARVDRPNC